MEHVDETTVDVWVNLVKAHRGAFAGVEMTLKAADCPPLEWYDALLELRRAPEGLRLQALEARMLLAQYNVSRLADRLEAAGYLQKLVDPSDARSRVLTITSQGHSLLKSMWPTYAAAIEKAVGKKLSKSEAVHLSKLLGKLTA